MASAMPSDDPLRHPKVVEYGHYEVIPDLKLADMARVTLAILNSTTGTSADKNQVVLLLANMFSPLIDDFADFFCRVLVSPSAPEDSEALVQAYRRHGQADQLGTFPATIAKLSTQQEAYRDAAKTEANDASVIDIKEGGIVNILISCFGQGVLAILSTLFMPKGERGTTEAEMALGVNSEMLKEVVKKLSVKPGFRSKFERFEKGVEAALRWHQRAKSA